MSTVDIIVSGEGAQETDFGIGEIIGKREVVLVLGDGVVYCFGFVGYIVLGI